MGIIEGLKSFWRKYQERKIIEQAQRDRRRERFQMAYDEEMGKLKAQKDMKIKEIEEQRRREMMKRQRETAERLVFGYTMDEKQKLLEKQRILAEQRRQEMTAKQRALAEQMAFGRAKKKSA